jgi:hypothetical protein
MKSFCKNCESLQPSSFRLEHDAETRKPYEDLCCNTCHFVVATVQGREALAQPAQEPDALTIAYQSGYYDGKQAALAGREWNFCERCGKRTNDIHTCTPPQGAA